MNFRMFAAAAIAGIVVVGCNQESSVTSPVSEQRSSAVSKMSSAQGGQMIEINEGAWDEDYAEKYSVRGAVYCESNAASGNYSFFHIAKLVVTNESIQEEQSNVVVERTTSGTVAGETVEVSQDYPLAGATKNRGLRIHYRLNFASGEEGVQITSMEIVPGMGGRR